MARAEMKGRQDCGKLYSSITEETHTFDITGRIEILWKKMKYRLFWSWYVLVKS